MATFQRHAAREHEAAGRARDAERAYVGAGDVDAAIAMYTRSRSWDALLRLVGQHRKDQLTQVSSEASAALELGLFGQALSCTANIHGSMPFEF